MNTINDFTGDYEFLRNDYDVDVEITGFDDIYQEYDMTFSSVEYAFQALKSMDMADRVAIKSALSARAAKRAGRNVNLRPNWDDSRPDTMKMLLKKKFEDPALREKLLSTRGALLAPNIRGDSYWGYDDGDGENVLGKVLMAVRGDILESSNTVFTDAKRDFLKECGWKRDVSGDSWAGECWTPVWDNDEQFDLDSAVAHQTKINKQSADLVNGV